MKSVTMLCCSILSSILYCSILFYYFSLSLFLPLFTGTASTAFRKFSLSCIELGTHRAGGFGCFAALKNIESLGRPLNTRASRLTCATFPSPRPISSSVSVGSLMERALSCAKKLLVSQAVPQPQIKAVKISLKISLCRMPFLDLQSLQ